MATCEGSAPESTGIVFANGNARRAARPEVVLRGVVSIGEGGQLPQLLSVWMSHSEQTNVPIKAIGKTPRRAPIDGGGDEDRPDGSILVILVLLAFLAAALVFFASGWMQVNV